MDLTSKFATITGCQDMLDMYKIPNEWWSRKYEYPWASQFVAGCISKVVDAGCGVTHCFKDWLANTARQVTWVDQDANLLKMPTTPNVHVIIGDIAKMPTIPDASIDVIFCISVLEHVTPIKHRAVILDEFARIIKPDGLVIITVDVPTIPIDQYTLLIECSKLDFAGEVILKEPDNILIQPAGKLRVFCSVLRRRL